MKWILERIEGKASANETPIGFVPKPESLTLEGLDVPREAIEELLRVNSDDWIKEHGEVGSFFKEFGNRFPAVRRFTHQLHIRLRKKKRCDAYAN